MGPHFEHSCRAFHYQEETTQEAAKNVEQRRKRRSEEEEDSIAAKNAWPYFVVKRRIFGSSTKSKGERSWIPSPLVYAADELHRVLRKLARQCVIEKLDRFDGRDISKFCRAYEEAMEDNGIDDSVAIENFHLIVKPELRGPIEELQGQHSVSWRNFKVALKAEYFLEDSQRVTKQTFIKWVQMKNKGLTSRELLREFEKKFDQLSTGEQQSLRSEKVELFVQAADSRLQKSLVQLLEDPDGELGLTNDWDVIPKAINLLVKCQKKIDKSIVVDSHEDFEENGIVEKIVEKPKVSSSPTLEGKEKPKATQSSTLDDSTMDDLIKDENEEEVKASTNLWPHALRTAKVGKVTSFTLRQVEDSIRETTRWTDPVDSLSVYAYIAKAQANEAFVEDKRKREDEAPETSKRQTQANTRSDGERMQKSTPIPKVQMEDATKDKKQSKSFSVDMPLPTDVHIVMHSQVVLDEDACGTEVVDKDRLAHIVHVLSAFKSLMSNLLVSRPDLGYAVGAFAVGVVNCPMTDTGIVHCGAMQIVT
ncbi:hypothetical protein L7F22_051540 [Adiantum nelumboides]|nr:hypothetical protein [Adiantum nelumboides]